VDDTNPDAITTTTFEHERGHRRFTLRDAVVCLVVVFGGLLLCYGGAPLHAAQAMAPGTLRDVAVAAARPPAWVARNLPFASAAHRATAWLSPDDKLDARGSFAATGAVPAGGVPPVTEDAFDPAALGARPVPRGRLRTLLVTGDSMSTPLDEDIARRLAGGGVKVVRDPHLGSGISKSFLVDWGQLSTSQVRKQHPDAVVVFIGANEGFPLDRIQCCGPGWAAAYASRVRRMIYTYRQNGAARVYWITLPTPRAANRAKVARVVDAAIPVAAEPWRRQVRVIDSVPIFTPAGYRAAMPVNGTDTIVRASDGIHLNETGANLLAGVVLDRIRQDFDY
jgi:lysophospholipase L1-like esterase